MQIINIINEEINKFLNEGISDIVFHGTSINSLISILKQDKILGATNIGTGSDLTINKERFFYFSTTRSRHPKTGYSGGDVRLKLNGRKLGQRYKGAPVDYWQWSKDPKDWNDKTAYHNALTSTEMEDRLLLNSPEIDNASTYIMEIHVLLSWYTKKSHINNILMLSRQRGLGNVLFFYDDQNGFANMNTGKAISYMDALTKVKDDDQNVEKSDEMPSYRWRDYLTILTLISRNNRNTEYEIENFLANNFSNKRNDIMDKMKEIEKEFEYASYVDWRLNEKYTTVSNAIHNNRSNSDNFWIFIVKLLAKDMKANGFKNLKEYFYSKFK